MSIHIKNILVGYDGFDRNEAIPALALSLAKEHGARLHLVHVAPKAPYRVWKLPGVSVEELYEALVDKRRQQLEVLAVKARTRGINTRATIRTGSPHVQIIREAMSVKADLVIVSDEPDRQGKRGFHTVTMKLLRECPCPVLAKRDHRKFRHRHIVAAVDVEPSPSDQMPGNRRIVEMAAALANDADSQVTLLHCWSLWGELILRNNEGTKPEEVRELLEVEKQERARELKLLLDACDIKDAKVETKLLKGQVRDLLPKFVAENKIDLVVMGTVSRTGLRRLLVGNTAEKLINELTCSLLATKPDGFVSPVRASDDEEDSSDQ